MSAQDIKLNIEGDTYVIPGEEDNPSEIVAADEGDWNDFRTLGKDDAEYISPQKVDIKKFRSALKRAKNLHVSESVLASALGKVA